MTTVIVTHASKPGTLTHGEADANFVNLAATADQAASLAMSLVRRPIVTVNTSPYTLALTDATAVVYVAVEGNVVFNIPGDSIVPLPVGTQVDVVYGGTGVVTFAPGAAVTTSSVSGFLTTPGGFSAVTLFKHAANSWFVIGTLVA